MDKIKSYAAPMLVVGCVLFGLGSLIVKFVPVGGYAIAFWRLLIASFILQFSFLILLCFHTLKLLLLQEL